MGLVPFLFFCWYDLGIWFWSAKDGQATFMPAGPSQITRCLRVSENIGQATSQFSLTLAVVQPSVLPTPEPFAMWLGLTEQCWSDKNTCIMPNGHIPNETRRSDHQKGNWELSRWCSNTGNSVKKNEQTLTHPGCLNQSWLQKPQRLCLLSELLIKTAPPINSMRDSPKLARSKWLGCRKPDVRCCTMK